MLVLSLISGAGGSRTRVQARQPYAFYMLILCLIVGSDEVTGNRITPYLLCFHRQAGETIRLSLSCVRFLIGLVQGVTARETSRPNTLCRDKA